MIERVRELAPYFEQAVHSLKGSRHITDIRNFGLAAGITLAARPGEPARRPMEAALACWRKGVYVRFGGDTPADRPSLHHRTRGDRSPGRNGA